MELKRDGPDSLYRQIADDLEHSIHEGTLRPLERLPSEQELMLKYGVSRVTVRKAIDFLEHKNLVVRRQGRGTFATGPVVHQDPSAPFYEALAAQGVQYSTQLLEYGLVTPAESVAAAMRLAGSQVARAVRVYSITETPIGVAVAHMPAELIDRLTREQIAELSGYAQLQLAFGVKVAYAQLHIRSQLCESWICSLLGLHPSESLLILERTSFSDDDQAVEHTQFFLRSDAYEFGLTIRGGLRLLPGVQASNTSTR